MKKLTILCFLLIGFAATSASANTILTVGAGGTATDHILGEIIPAVSSSDGGNGLLARDQEMINTLLDMSLGQRTLAGVTPEYYRATTDYGTLTDAVLAGAVGVNAADMTTIGTTIQITLTGSYMYLVGAWDGQNSGAEVWYIGDLAAGTVIEIPRYAYPVPDSGKGGKDAGSAYPQNLVNGAADAQYQITTYSLFNPFSVPDGGTTAALLGLGMLGVGVARRFWA